MLKKNSLLYKIPIIIFAAITPLIMYLKKIEITGDLFNVYNGVHSWSDFFNYYKMVWIIISFLLILVLFMSVKDSSKWRDIWRPVINKLLISLAVLIVLSSLFSSYKYIVVFGFVDRYEGLLVQLAYIFFTIYIGYIVESYDDLKPIITGIVISSTVVGVIGASEFFGHNVLSTTLGRKLITPVAYHGMIDKINFSIGGKSISSTLYNPNFVGSYMAITSFLGMGLYIKSTNHLKSFLYAIYTCLMVFCLVGCNSAAGKLGFIAAALLMILIFRKKIFQGKNAIVILFMSLIFIFPILLGLNSGVINEIDRTEVALQGTTNTQDNSLELNVKDNKITFIFPDEDGELNEYSLILDDKKLKSRINGKNVFLKFDKDSLIIEPKNKMVKDNFKMMMSNDRNAILVKYRTKFSIMLKMTPDGFVLFDQYQRPWDYQEKFDEWSYLVGKEKIGSSRGYIWKMSLPIMKDYIFIGSGPDTYAAVFPQNDLLGKLKHLSGAYSYVDKPHNMYIQIGIQSGLLSLGIYIGILFIYGFDSLKIYFKKKSFIEREIMGVALLCSVFAYSIAAFFNDSNVSTGPIFWTVFGIGLVLNSINREQNEKEV